MFNHSDTIDIRDIIEQIEGLESDIEDLRESEQMSDQTAADEADEELQTLLSLMDELNGQGGDEQWRGDWYPLTLIHENYFVDAMRQLMEDVGDIPHPFPSYIVIDWEATAENLRVDYSSVEIEGHTYWFR